MNVSCGSSTYIATTLVALAIGTVTAIPIPTVAESAEPASDTTATYYYCDSALYSCKPGNEAATYQSYGGGGFGPGGTDGTGIHNSHHKCEVEITGEMRHNRFIVLLKVTPEKEDKVTHARRDEFDLTDLTPKSIEVARDDDGRVYRFSLFPQLRILPVPEQFDARRFNLADWTFPESPVIVNDQDYVGELSMGRGSLCWFDVPGLARVELSLLHLKDAAPTGTLQNGVINLTGPDGTTVRISNVKNGAYEETLAGGPYKVWVKWEKSHSTAEEFRKMSQEEMADLKEQAKEGNLPVPSQRFDRFLKNVQNGRLHMMEYGTRQLDPDELAKPTAKK